MKTKEEILDFLEKNNCNQELINDVKNGDGYNWIALCYENFGVKFTELVLQQKQAKSGWGAWYIALSYVENGVKFTELALQQEKAKDGFYVGFNVYCIANKMFNESKKD